MNSPLLIPSGVGLALFLVSIACMILDDWPKAVAIMLSMSGVLVSLAFIVYPPWQSAGAGIEGLHLWGLNFMLAIFIWSLAVSYFEAYQFGSMDPESKRAGGGHHVRTPLGCFIAGFSLLLCSVQGLDVVGIGVILLGLTAIFAWKKQWRHAAVICACCGGACVAGYLLLKFTGLANVKVFDLKVSWYIALVAGLVVGWKLYRQHADFKHVSTSIWAALFGVTALVAGGHFFENGIDYVTHAGVTTVSQINRKGSHGDKNPLDQLFRKADKALTKKLSGHHHHGPSHIPGHHHH